jgi:hypothetical protein
MPRRVEAAPDIRRAAEVFEPLAEGPAAVPGNRSLFAMSCTNLGMLLVNTGRPADGEKFLRRSADVKRKLTSDYPEVAHYHAGLGQALSVLAGVVRDRGEVEPSVPIWEEAVEQQRIALKGLPGDAELRLLLGETSRGLIDVRLRLGRYREAERGVAELPALLTDRGQGEYDAARLLSRCLPLVEKDALLSTAERAELQTRYAERAVEFLRQAMRKGRADRAAIDREADFAPLRSRPDFQEMLKANGP